MLRVVCDVGVVVSGVLSAAGPPGRVLDRWRDGEFDLIVSPAWLEELSRALERPKIVRYLGDGDASELLGAIRLQGDLIADPTGQPGLTADPGDDYLASLARAANANFLVSGDGHLTTLINPRPPVLTPREFDDLLGSAR